MRMITGFLPATEGTVSASGFGIFEKPREVKKRIGYLPEHPPVCEDMTVRGYLKFLAKVKPRTTKTATIVIDIFLPPVLESGYHRFSPVFDTVLLLGS
jgi:ABC-2 type transport system ATP-binding protein